MTNSSAATAAKRLLVRAARHLGTADPVAQVGVALEESLPLPQGDEHYYHDRTFEPNFAETDGRSLAFQLSPGGPLASGPDRVELATRWMRHLVGANFGTEAARWFDGRAEPARGSRKCGCAWFGSGFDPSGLMETNVTYQWGSQLNDALPQGLFRIVRTVAEMLPGLTPAFTTIRCGRTSGSQQITFDVNRALPLIDLKPLMERLGLGAQHAGLMSAVAFILGARFTLPPDVATLTLRPTRSGLEMRLDVNLDALPDTPTQLLSLLRIQLAERPANLRALDRWITAMTPEGYDGPGSVTVLSVRVRSDMPARVALYLRPTTLEQPDAAAAPPQPAPTPNGGERRMREAVLAR